MCYNLSYDSTSIVRGKMICVDHDNDTGEFVVYKYYSHTATDLQSMGYDINEITPELVAKLDEESEEVLLRTKDFEEVRKLLERYGLDATLVPTDGRPWVMITKR